MIKIKESDIEDITHACPYCGDEKRSFEPWQGCCGETSEHFEKAYIVTGHDGRILESECEIDMNYGVNTFAELVKAIQSYLQNLETTLDLPELQIKADKHGNEACRLIRSRTRVSMQQLKDILRRANDKELK